MLFHFFHYRAERLERMSYYGGAVVVVVVGGGVTVVVVVLLVVVVVVVGQVEMAATPFV